jgi:hypothetical protein
MQKADEQLVQQAHTLKEAPAYFRRHVLHRTFVLKIAYAAT